MGEPYFGYNAARRVPRCADTPRLGQAPAQPCWGQVPAARSRPAAPGHRRMPGGLGGTQSGARPLAGTGAAACRAPGWAVKPSVSKSNWHPRYRANFFGGWLKRWLKNTKWFFNSKPGELVGNTAQRGFCWALPCRKPLCVQNALPSTPGLAVCLSRVRRFWCGKELCRAPASALAGSIPRWLLAEHPW